MWVNIGVEVVVVRRLREGRWCLACPSSLVDLPCAVACAVLLRAGAPVLGGASACPNPRPSGWWRSLSGSIWDEAGAGFWGVRGLLAG